MSRSVADLVAGDGSSAAASEPNANAASHNASATQLILANLNMGGTYPKKNVACQ
jgi:hypothetical protein